MNPWRAGEDAEMVESRGSEIGMKQSLVRGLWGAMGSIESGVNRIWRLTSQVEDSALPIPICVALGKSHLSVDLSIFQYEM